MASDEHWAACIRGTQVSRGSSQSLQEVRASTADRRSEQSTKKFVALGGQGWMWFVTFAMS
jgi:hypothetical protein